MQYIDLCDKVEKSCVISPDMHRLFNRMADMLKAVYDTLAYKALPKLTCVPKEGRKEYGYYMSYNVIDVYQLMCHYNCCSIVDLGSGAGLFMNMMKLISNHYNKTFQISGIENEIKLIEIAEKLMYNSSKFGDLTELQPQDLSYNDCVYFWEPIMDKELNKKFITSLLDSLKQGGYIFYRCAGNALECLRAEKRAKYLGEYKGIYVFVKK